MKSEFYELLELRERWNHLHQLGDQAGTEKALTLAELDGKKSHPEALLKILKQSPSELREKLLHFGREWEAKLTSVALREGLSVLRVALTLDPKQLEPFRLSLSERLLHPEPWGGILFFENARKDAIIEGLWHAFLYLLIEPDVKTSELNLENTPGVAEVQEISKIA